MILFFIFLIPIYTENWPFKLVNCFPTSKEIFTARLYIRKLLLKKMELLRRTWNWYVLGDRNTNLISSILLFFVLFVHFYRTELNYSCIKNIRSLLYLFVFKLENKRIDCCNISIHCGWTKSVNLHFSVLFHDTLLKYSYKKNLQAQAHPLIAVNIFFAHLSSFSISYLCLFFKCFSHTFPFD